MKRGWQVFENYVTHQLGLDATIHSGNKFFDQGDAVSRGRGLPFPLFADAKYTEHFSRALKLSELCDCAQAAAKLGKRMIMPIRFWPPEHTVPQDYVVLSLHDFAELMELVHDD